MMGLRNLPQTTADAPPPPGSSNPVLRSGSYNLSPSSRLPSQPFTSTSSFRLPFASMQCTISVVPALAAFLPRLPPIMSKRKLAPLWRNLLIGLVCAFVLVAGLCGRSKPVQAPAPPHAQKQMRQILSRESVCGDDGEERLAGVLAGSDFDPVTLVPRRSGMAASRLDGSANQEQPRPKCSKCRTLKQVLEGAVTAARGNPAAADAVAASLKKRAGPRQEQEPAASGPSEHEGLAQPSEAEDDDEAASPTRSQKLETPSGASADVDSGSDDADEAEYEAEQRTGADRSVDAQPSLATPSSQPSEAVANLLAKPMNASVLAESTSLSRTVIVTALSEAWAPMMHFFLYRLQQVEQQARKQRARERGRDVAAEAERTDEIDRLVDRLVVVAYDDKSFELCCSLGLHCYFDWQEDAEHKEDFSGEQKQFMTPAYIHLVWRKVHVVRSILSLGYDVIFTDNDILWTQNPLPRLLLENPEDLHMSVDWWFPNPHAVVANGGFYAARSNARTIKFFSEWITWHRRFPHHRIQQIYDWIRPEANPFTRSTSPITVRYLPTDLFGGFCEMGNKLHELVTIHATCCYGMDNKLRVLKKLADDLDWLQRLPLENGGELEDHGFKWRRRSCSTD
eukprot:TRINITY_DN1431_c0_g2_i1.p1 TRINITY_DN1431_c0_g2~~TRINITY_DN1431_c0_g2_i1.p1  ORF type:complete len:623 (-),score=-35.74 TRINITY_DN1431_c0_g2_i1:494-2362(-)